jgi:hypothetical protein
MTDMDFFRKEVASHLSSFNLEYRSYADGDFGALEQVVFNTQDIGGTSIFGKVDGWEYIYTIISRIPKSAIYYLNHQKNIKKHSKRLLRKYL